MYCKTIFSFTKINCTFLHGDESRLNRLLDIEKNLNF